LVTLVKIDASVIKHIEDDDYDYYIARVNKKPDSKKYMYVYLYDTGYASAKFPKIPKDIYYLDIDFTGSEIEYPEIPKNIKSLTFYGSRNSKFPKDLPKGLLRLSFSECVNINEIPDISYLKKLRSFEFFESSHMKDINSRHLPKKLEKLQINFSGLTKFPKNLPKTLTHIDLGNQKITTFPNINYLEKLKKFIMSRNPLNSFPKEPPRKDIYIELVNMNYPIIERGMVYPPPGYIPNKLKKVFDKAYTRCQPTLIFDKLL
jgi:Leucine-rich repeat (LRR) protein